MKISYKLCSSAHFGSAIRYIWISGVIAYFGFLSMQWTYHQSELGRDSCSLRWLVAWIRRKLLVKFRRHQTSYLSHVLSAVNMKSLLIYFRKWYKTQFNITGYTCSKLNEEFQIFTFTKHSFINVGIACYSSVQNILYLHPPQNLTRPKTSNVQKRLCNNCCRTKL